MKISLSLNKKIWISLSCYVVIIATLIPLSYHQCNILAGKEAEKSLANFLLNHRAIHSFVEEVQKPEIYRLKDIGKLYRGYFSPQILSFTYIARNIKDALNNELIKENLDPIYFKLASQNPRNSINLADGHELELLQAFNNKIITEYKKIIENEKKRDLYYAIPIAPNKESCMRCHGEPSDAPVEMIEQYGDKAGFHEKMGEIRALISVRVPMAGFLQDAKYTAFNISIAIAVLFTIGFVMLISFFYSNEKQKRIAQEHSYYLNSILQSSSNTAIVASGLNYDVKYFNRAAEKIFGIPVDSALRSNLREIHDSNDMVSTDKFKHGIDILKEYGNYDFSFQRNGRTIEAYTYTIKDGDGNLAGFLLLGNDVTDRIVEEEKKNEMRDRLQKAERMESIGLMAGGIAHDLNNILAGIVGYPELMLMQLPEESKLRKPIEQIMKSGQRAAIVVADLLTVARGAASTMAVTTLNALVLEYFESSEYHNLTSIFPNVRCSYQLSENPPNILCSPVHVQKCIMNIAINSAEAIKGSGEIIFRTDQSAPPADWESANKADQEEYAVLIITDTGSGISDKDIKHIFEPFYTKKKMGRSGSGLGLAVVWNTLKEHGGTVDVRSTPKGSSFKLYFPVTHEPVELKQRCQDELMQGKGETILVVDDEPQLLDIASSMLEACGYNVSTVNSGEEAVSYLQNQRVDIVLIDMLMEPGINGRETYEHILQIHPGQKAIIASGFAENSEVRKTLSLGASVFIKKPYSMADIAKAVKDVLGCRK